MARAEPGSAQPAAPAATGGLIGAFGGWNLGGAVAAAAEAVGGKAAAAKETAAAAVARTAGDVAVAAAVKAAGATEVVAGTAGTMAAAGVGTTTEVAAAALMVPTAAVLAGATAAPDVLVARGTEALRDGLQHGGKVAVAHAFNGNANFVAEGVDAARIRTASTAIAGVDGAVNEIFQAGAQGAAGGRGVANALGRLAGAQAASPMMLVRDAARLVANADPAEGGAAEARPAGDEEDVDEEQGTCVVCLEAKADTVILPCRHAQFCHGCAATLSSRSQPCPTCRGRIESTLRIFL